MPLLDSSIASIVSTIPTHKVNWQLMDSCGLALHIRRDDLLPAWCQGNKFYKLYYNLKNVKKTQTLLSFGGAFSNHIHALALASKAIGLASVGVIRGERAPQLSPTLLDAESAGMHLVFITRAQYRALTNESCEHVLRQRCSELTGIAVDELTVIPEGGANSLGMSGCVELAQDIKARAGSEIFDDVLLPVGTGTTLAGLALGFSAGWQVSGISVLGRPVSSAGENTESRIAAWLATSPAVTAKWRVITGYHLGGYAKTTPELLEFMVEFERETGVPVDHVYTGKLFWAIAQLAKQGHWQPGARLLALHTGGLQGCRGLMLK